VPQAAFTEQGAALTFHVSHEVTILGISLFVTGLGTGPLLVGPLSEVYGTSNMAIQNACSQAVGQVEILYTKYLMRYSSSSHFPWCSLQTSVSTFIPGKDDRSTAKQQLFSWFFALSPDFVGQPF
jgi:hypothetical protein